MKHRFKHHSAWLRALMAPLVKFYLKRKWAKLDSVEAPRKG
ncbi:Alkylated repair protein alkB [Vibrio cholerae]|nr:Alkylated repair protein alkB [Vibrio cholerae]